MLGNLGGLARGFVHIHGASVDQEGNLYVAEVANGRAQIPSPHGCESRIVVGKPIYSAWK